MAAGRRSACLVAALASLQMIAGFSPTATPRAHGFRVLRRASAGPRTGARLLAAQAPVAGGGAVPPSLPALQALQGDVIGMYNAHPVAATAAGVLAAAVALTAASSALPKQTSSPYPRNVYDAKAAALYFRERPFTFAKRALFITLSAAGFALNVLFDILTDSYEQNEPQRADELTDLLTRLGPTFIKIGQSLSIRTDLLTPEYLRSLTALQDKVPAFPTDVARATISEQLGQPWDSVFSGIDDPVAAASLGQVYKAKLKDGRDVAVKVQRPNILEQVALDMHLIRVGAPLARALGAPGDIEGLVDDWGFGFVNELDYQQEANNAEAFMASFQGTPLEPVVFSPPVVRDCSARRVLTTEWIEGERLEKSSAEDVSTLCSVAMNTYLTMMLQTGTMHCDPHPGNLLRTPDGRLCILDWGLVQEMPADLRLTMIEHIAHLVSRDYAKVPNDLVLLGFVPEGQEEAVKSGNSSRVIAETYTKLMAGGGAANIDVNAVFSDLQDLTASYGNLFQIPPYFAYIARAFGVLEGIGLTNNPNYAIIAECLPYISQRLLTDPNPRTAGALQTFIFGADKDDPDRVINSKRVLQLVEGFGDYSSAAKATSTLAVAGTAAGGTARGAPGSLESTVDAVADQIFDLLLTEESSPLQAIVLEQLARILSAGARQSWQTLRERSGRLRNGRSVLGTLIDPLGIFAKSGLVAVDDADEKVCVCARARARSLSHLHTLTDDATGAEHDAGAGEDPAAADGDGHRSARVPQCVGCGCCDTDCLAQAVEASPRGGYACAAVPSRVCARMSMVSVPQSAACELTLRRPLTPWLRGV